MDLTVSTSYQLSRDGQQYGPYQAEQLVQMAHSQQVLPTDHIWAEGMAEWTPAQSFSQLAAIFSAAAQQQAAAAPAAAQRPAGVNPAVLRKGAAGPGSVRPGGAKKKVSRRRGAAAAQSASLTGKKGANFSILGWSLGVFLLGVILAIVGAVMVGASAPSIEEVSNENFEMPETSPVATAMIIGGGLLYPIGLLVYAIFSLIYLYRGWSNLQVLPEVRSTPGKAIGFLFIPFFNIYWLFVAYYGWAMDYNILKQRSGAVGAPAVPAGLFLAFCILALLSIPILHPFVMLKVCQGTNFLAATPDEELAGAVSA